MRGTAKLALMILMAGLIAATSSVRVSADPKKDTTTNTKPTPAPKTTPATKPTPAPQVKPLPQVKPQPIQPKPVPQTKPVVKPTPQTSPINKVANQFNSTGAVPVGGGQPKYIGAAPTGCAWGQAVGMQRNGTAGFDGGNGSTINTRVPANPVNVSSTTAKTPPAKPVSNQKKN